jgi:hypothetical protein
MISCRSGRGIRSLEGCPAAEGGWRLRRPPALARERPSELVGWVRGWQHRAASGARDDAYLLYPRSRGVSVKLRAGGTLDVKVYRGSPGTLDVAGQARGRLEVWQKWAFPFDRPSQDSGRPAGWRPVSKKRLISRFSLGSG